MPRCITVKGQARIHVKPDQVILTIGLSNYDMSYEDTLSAAAESLEKLKAAVMAVGFDQSDLKTSAFDVRINHESYRDDNNDYKTRFAGYICEQNLKLTFDLDQKRLASILNALAESQASPNFDIQFTVKDKDAVSEALLTAATKNARRKAEILADASNVKLGDLLSIEYNRVDVALYSPTHLLMGDEARAMKASFTPEIEAEDIEVHDNVTFVWMIG